MSRVPVRRALVSVSDKTDLVPFGRRLETAGVELVATQGTAAALREADVETLSLSRLTGAGELLEGLVKSIHPRVAAGILADRARSGHISELEEAGIELIDLVVVNLYPFEDVAGPSREEMIDIGGVTLLRAAAKNHRWVGAVSDHSQYGAVAEGIETGGLTDHLRLELAREALFRTVSFDSRVLAWMQEEDRLPGRIVVPLRRGEELRYGENPHQVAATYLRTDSQEGWWASARQVRGKPLSFNNYLDADAAWQLVNAFERPAAVVIKHTNPCGVAVRDTALESFVAAWECDPLPAYGGVVAVNRSLDADTAHELEQRFVDLLVAPAFERGVAKILESRRALRLLEAAPPQPVLADLRSLTGGFLVQDPDRADTADWKVTTRRPPTDGETPDLEFAWRVAAHTTSNAVVIARDLAAVGVGAGDQSRVGAAERAIRQAGERAVGAVAASDGFLPFRDSIDLLANAGVTALVQPGGSIRDEEVVETADDHDMAVVFTGRRHFRH